MNRAAATQRARRARMVRIDYMPGEAALEVIREHQADQPAGTVSATNSAVIDAIVLEWAELTGRPIPQAETPDEPHGISAGDTGARADASVRQHVLPAWSGEYLERIARREASARVICGARRHRDGQPCQAKSEPGKRRCRFHGGRSTGPRTPEGKARALANLRQFRAQGGAR